MLHKEMLAMLLAGGQGSRLGCLTRNVAKPAVPFGGKYRIIDFSLSNCNYSGIDTIGVLTQYKPVILNSYIGIGSAWDLDVRDGGVTVLPPYTGEKGGEWYKGTANAIYQNIDFIDHYEPDYVLIISADHIYKMDYAEMLDYHRAKKAELTIAVIEVPWDEASRFGIMSVDKDNHITEFAEKPNNPKSNLASMGIYIFNWPVLKEFLLKDEAEPNSEHDFGKNIIPRALREGRSLSAYRFRGYWKDVGTIESFYSANMDLLCTNPEFDIFDDRIKIYSQAPILPPHYLSAEAKVTKSLIADGCMIMGEVDQCILFPGVYIGPGSKVCKSILMPNVRIGANTKVAKAIIGENTTIGGGSHIGYDCTESDDIYELTVIGDNIFFPNGVEIKKSTVINQWEQEQVTVE